MRFAMVTTFYPPHHFGGDAVFIKRLVHALARRGHEVEVIYDADAFRALAPQREVQPETQPPRVTVHPLSAGSPLRGFLSTLATQQLGRPLVHGARIRALLARGRFDVVHFHNVSLVGGPGVLGLAPPDAVTLYMAHEHWLVCPTHVLWRHNRERCDERQCLRCVLRHKRPPQLWRYTGLLEREAAHVDVFYSPSRFSAEKHAQFGFPRALEVIPYFLPDLDSAAEPPERLTDRPSEAPFFLFVGRLEKIKGLQDVIPVFAGDAGEELWIAGAGDYEPELRRLAEGRPRVRFLGARTPEQLRGLYREALAVVAPSVCYETFGIVLLEAFREGTPVIARRLGPFTEIVEGSGGGLLFDDEPQLRRALALLAGDAEQRRALGAAGQRALRARWTESVVLERYFATIARAAEKKNPGLARQLAEA
jgi:glycosyltransferase involved in cell wall biosynthesis